MSAMINAFLSAYQYYAGNPIIFVLITIGVFFGLIFGIIPGLTATLAVTLILPFTYQLTTEMAIAVLIGIYVGGISGGLYGAILLNIPGTPASLVTCFDGYPMARKGQASLALSLGIFCSLIGGMFSGIVLVFLSPLLAKIALIFGPFEFAALGFMGLSVVVSLTAEDLIKGLIGMIIGVLISMVGIDPITYGGRFTFGFWQLTGGLPLLATLMGFFALGEILFQSTQMGGESTIIEVKEKIMVFPPMNILKKSIKLITLSSVIGTWIGILPGVGQSTASLIAYNQGRKLSKTPEKFGTGHYEGIIASETANNAVNGGALIPMITLGIPGDLVTSVLLGALIIHGLDPGPLLFQKNIEVVGSVFVSYLISNIIMFVIATVFLKILIKFLKVPYSYLFPIIIIMCVLGAFTIRNRIFDCWVLLITGVFAYLLRMGQFNLPPIVLGIILGPIIEFNFRLAMQGNYSSIKPFFSRPISLILVIISFYTILSPVFLKKINQRKN